MVELNAVEKELENELNPQPEQAAPEPTDDVPAKGQSEAKEKPPVKDDDPEFDLGLDQDGKTPLKLKRSQILEYKKGNMLQADYTKKTQEVAAEKAQMKELVQMIDYLKQHPNKAKEIIAVLERKEEQLIKQEDKLEDKKDDIDTLLLDLDSDDPYAKVLRAQRKELQQSLKANKDLQERLSKIEQTSEHEAKSKLEAESTNTLRQVLDSEKKALEFLDDEESEYWKKQVLTYMLNSPQEYSNLEKEEFVEYLKGISQKVHADMMKFGEKRVKKYIESKGEPSKVPHSAVPAGGKPLSKKPTFDNLQELIEENLTDELKK